jgi:hypothetical protein
VLFDVIRKRAFRMSSIDAGFLEKVKQRVLLIAFRLRGLSLRA